MTTLREKTRKQRGIMALTKLQLVLVLNQIGWESSESFPDQSYSKRANQIIPDYSQHLIEISFN